MSGLAGLGAKIDTITDDLPHIAFRWDTETQILSGLAEDVQGERGLTGSIELEDKRGAVITLDFAGGVLRGLEVVVWPRLRTVDTLAPPDPDRRGRFTVPARPSQPGVAVLEIDVPLAADRSADESVIHLRVGRPRAVERVHVADNLLLEVDSGGDVAGFWLLSVPPFPAMEGYR